MAMSIKQLRAFLAVAHSLNFAQASVRLNLSQPALSLAIRNLEDTLGGALFVRTTRQVRLTPEGEAFFPLVRQLLVDWDNTVETIRQRFTLQIGRVAIAVIPSFAANPLPFILQRFRCRYAGVNVVVHDVINEAVYEMIAEGRVEMGIAFEPESDARLHFTPLGMNRFIAVVPPACSLARQQDIGWRQLLSLDFITLQRPSSMRLLLEQRLAQHGQHLSVAFESHQLITVGNMVANGLGVSAVPAWCARQMRQLGAVCLPLTDPVIENRFGLVSLRHHPFSCAAQAMADTICDYAQVNGGGFT
ncbi:LysR family transcriptional regulator [Edwardsiella hoshinae]|uniref:LysR family transcriptional regulator n=1 Tax=Edwardsiella hoshinae TaxID=93378 RepID=A0ABM6EI81_9GAMM|nr:LysR family transcriptional regulator [Edwardsiella hoshinae]AOV96625.1 LysR family transcriptional regulator [Edwardsiella hoshinae]